MHNQVSAGLIPGLAAYRAKLPAGALRDQVDDLIREIQKLTVLDESALAPQVAAIADSDLRAEQMTGISDGGDAARRRGRGARQDDGDRARRGRRGTDQPAPTRAALVDLDITAAQVLQQRGSTLLGDGRA